jgi:hypothetical protein
MLGIMQEPGILLLWTQYTPESADGTIDLKEAINALNHLISRQFWAYLVEQDKVSSPEIYKKIPIWVSSGRKMLNT